MLSVLIFGGLWTLFHGDGQLSRVKTQSAPLLQSVSIQNPANEAQCPLSVRTNDDKVGKQQFPSLCSRQWSREGKRSLQAHARWDVIWRVIQGHHGEGYSQNWRDTLREFCQEFWSGKIVISHDGDLRYEPSKCTI